MKNYFKLFSGVSIIVLILASVSCKKSSTSGGMTTHFITDVASSNPNFSDLVAALKRTGLDKALENGSASFTVFAPTNAAFATLLGELNVTSVSQIPVGTLTEVLLNHVISGSLTASQLKSGYYSTLAAGPSKGYTLSMYVDLMAKKINGGANITQTDIMADNGVIHVIDKVLLPMTIADNAVANSSFTSLVAALQKANLVSALADTSKRYTVFAPTNDAFTALLTSLGTSLSNLTAGTLSPILLYHVLSGFIPAASVKAGYFPTLSTAFGKNMDVQVAVGSGVLLNNSSNVIATDVVATNGIIHVIDKVLLPPTVVDLATQNSIFSTLVLAVVKADLATTLAGTGPFTVFAPTNDAFTALFAALKVSGIDALTKDQLTPILLAHVVSGNVQSGDLVSGSVPTLNSAAPLKVTVSGSGVTLNGNINVVLANVQGSNGVVHVIDKVIVP